MPFPGDLSSLYTRNRFMGEIEQPTQANSMTGPQFGGSPEQLMQILQHPAVQQGLQQFLGQGYKFDPSQIRQSPFLPQQFMQHHPMMGGMMNNAMANVAATPDAPMVSGAGSGMSRAMQGMMGGPEMLRQYQIRQMLAPMQAAGGMMPMQEFQRKEELLKLLQRGEEHGERMAEEEEGRRRNADATKAGQVQKTPYGLIMPGAQTPVPQELQGMTPRSAQMGSQPSFNLFANQGQQPFQSRGPQSFQPYDPNMLQQQTQAQHPERGATADEKKAETKAGMAGAKVDELRGKAQQSKSKASLNDRTDPNLRGSGRGGGRGGVNPVQIAGQYNKAESEYKNQVAKIEAARKAGQLDDAGYQMAKAQALAALQQSKANTDEAQGNPGASARGEQEASRKKQLPPQVSPNAQPQAQQQPSVPPQQGQQTQLHRDEAGNLWDMSNPQQPVYKGKAQ